MNYRTSLLLLSSRLLLAGCTVGPNYQRPAVQAPATFRAPEPTAGAEAASLADLKWWEVFKDEKLQELVRTALAQNYDLRDAVARVEAARAISALRGPINSQCERERRCAIRPRLSRNGPTASAGVVRALAESHFGRGTLNLLSFEVDIWGRLRRATEAARANLLSAEENRKAVMTTLVSDVASAYFSLRELDYELEISRRTLATRQDSLDLIRTARPAASRRCSICARPSNWCTPRLETIPALQQQIEQTENQISLLLGKNPGEVVRGTEPHRTGHAAGRAGRPAFGSAGAPSGHSRGGTEPDRGQCRDRRRQGGLFSANQPERVPGRAEHAAIQALQRAEQGLELRPASDAADLYRRAPQVEREAGGGADR